MIWEGVPSGCALGNSLGLRPYFAVCSSSLPNTNTVYCILNHQIMEYWKTTVTILLPLLANIFSYWGLLRSGGLNTRKYWLVEVRRPQYEKILASRGDWEWLYCDSSRGIRWNIAWALRKSLGLRPRDFPRAQAIFHRIPLLSSQYS